MSNRTPNWSLWGNVPIAQVWEAIALSLDIDPRHVNVDPTGYMDGPQAYPYAMEGSDFNDRLEVAKRNLNQNGHLIPVSYDRISSARSTISLPAFGTWAEKLGWRLPYDFPIDDGSTLQNPQESNGSAPKSDGERHKLLKHVAVLALLLAEKSNRYKKGDSPNANQIAEAIGEIIDALPDTSRHGLGSSSIRESISAGLALLTK